MDDKSRTIDELKNRATAGNRKAINELERRGFSFCVHFGYENAADILRSMDIAFHGGFLYEYLQKRHGIA